MSVQTEYHVVRMDARDLNFTVLNFAQSLLEALNGSDFVQQNAANHKLTLGI
jgi:hypothetical protein